MLITGLALVRGGAGTTMRWYSGYFYSATPSTIGRHAEISLLSSNVYSELDTYLYDHVALQVL